MATTYAQAAVAANPDDALGYEILAEIYFRRRLYTDALKFAEAANDIHSDDATQRLLAEAYVRLGRIPKAINVLHELEQGNPDDPFTQLLLTYAYHKLGDPVQSLKHFNEVKRLVPDAFNRPDSYQTVIYTLETD